MKKALNAILFIAAAWALNTGTHSFRRRREGAHWRHQFSFVSQEIQTALLGNTENVQIIEQKSGIGLCRCHIFTELVDNLVKSRLHNAAGGGAQLGFLRQHV